MKILNEGDEKIARWWIGAELKCEYCGRRVKLEKEDDRNPHWLPFPGTLNEVHVECAMCGTMMIKRKDA